MTGHGQAMQRGIAAGAWPRDGDGVCRMAAQMAGLHSKCDHMIDTPTGGHSGDADHAALRRGQRIGRYVIVSVLGQGGFGITYRARDSELGREVAIKEYLPAALAVRLDGTAVLPRSTTMAEDFTWGRERFVAEGRTLASLDHAPAIVRVFDFLQANGTAYIVMELLSGETLDRCIRQNGPLGPGETERILWPLLDGLEQVHNAGFLHRDIKPANILLDATGSPTLIDFGASRAAMAGRNTALTAIFTPGYAAAEQMTSASQGPWTDIYSLSATLYHAITGKAPPSAFDRMLDDACEPLGRMALPHFGRGVVAGIDAGLAVRVTDRPQSIADWRPVLSQVVAARSAETVALAQAPPTVRSASATPAEVPPPRAPAPARRRGVRVLVGGLVAMALLLSGGYYVLVGDARSSRTIAALPDKAAQDAPFPADVQRHKDQEELARLRAENERLRKAEQDAAHRKEIEEETRRKIESEMAEKSRLADEARQKADREDVERKRRDLDAQNKADADEAARRQVEEAPYKAAEASESSLRLTMIDRQHIQVALTALGFNTRGADGVFGTHTRDMIAAWQKARGAPQTGFVTGAQNQVLLKDAAAAISRFDEDRKRSIRTAGDENERPGPAAPRAAPAPSAPVPPTSGASSLPVIVQSEPPSGSLARGQVILVDDGTCPAGQIKEVTAGSGNQRVQRTRRCIPRPRN